MLFLFELWKYYIIFIWCLKFLIKIRSRLRGWKRWTNRWMRIHYCFLSLFFLLKYLLTIFKVLLWDGFEGEFGVLWVLVLLFKASFLCFLSLFNFLINASASSLFSIWFLWIIKRFIKNKHLLNCFNRKSISTNWRFICF